MISRKNEARFAGSMYSAARMDFHCGNAIGLLSSQGMDAAGNDAFADVVFASQKPHFYNWSHCRIQ